MKRFDKKYNYDGKMDKEVIDLCNVLNELPGIKTNESCSGHGKNSLNIWFKVGNTNKGLFFLTRCIDRRYWKYGHFWGIDLSVGDMFNGKDLPICYRLNSGEIKGISAYKQAKSLIDNMNYHLNHEAFMKGYNLKKQLN